MKDTTRGTRVWEYKANRIRRVENPGQRHRPGVPTDRMYWLRVMRQPATGDINYWVSNAGQQPSGAELIHVLRSRCRL